LEKPGLTVPPLRVGAHMIRALLIAVLDRTTRKIVLSKRN